MSKYKCTKIMKLIVSVQLLSQFLVVVTAQSEGKCMKQQCIPLIEIHF